MPWYRLPAPLQKHVCCGIQNVQNGAVLTIGPLAHLDFSTGSEVIFNFYLHRLPSTQIDNLINEFYFSSLN